MENSEPDAKKQRTEDKPKPPAVELPSLEKTWEEMVV